MSTKQFSGLGGAFIFLFATGIVACDDISDEDVNVEVLNGGEVADDDHIDFTPVDDEVTFRAVVDNGLELNGTNLNGMRLNGMRLNGMRLNGVLLNMIRQLASELSSLQFSSGSLLTAYDTTLAQNKTGAQLAGMVFDIGVDPLATGTDQNKKVKIKSVVQSSVQSDVYFYEVENEIATNTYETVCVDGSGNPVAAIAVKNSWDPTTGARSGFTDAITWACRGAAIAKGIEWGYRPWVSTAMEDAHQAAVRMIRADYCGDGTTHTTNGNAIDVADKWNIQVSDTTWDVEAKWGPDGAVCLNTPRKLQHSRASIPCAASLPYCTSNGLSNGSPNTNPSQYGGLLMTRAVPNNNASAY
jgi:hypothetical protein